MEQEAAEFISHKMTKPVVAFVAGSTAPPGKRMGHAGAIITGSAGRASEKIKALSQAGGTIAPTPAEIGLTAKKVLESL
jgi:succinyl-CoA synthetase alpha subunit